MHRIETRSALNFEYMYTVVCRVASYLASHDDKIIEQLCAL